MAAPTEVGGPSSKLPMRAIIQRVFEASVEVGGQVVGRCGKGFVVLAGAHIFDTETEAAKMADRILGVRLFNDEAGKINLSLRQLMAAGEEVGILAISNFTVYGDASENRRPSFVQAAPYEKGKELFDRFVEGLQEECPTQTGVFGADMKVSLVNDGPVTIVIDVDVKG